MAKPSGHARITEKLAQLTQKAVAAMQAGNGAEAERLFRRAAELKPPQVQALYNMGVFLRRDGRPGQAASWLRRALSLQGDHSDAMVELGLALLEDGTPREAATVLKDALTRAPKDDTALSALATAAFRSGDWQEARSRLHSLQQVRELTAEESLLHLRTLLECHETEAANEEAARIGKLHPELSGELLSALTRRSSGHLPLDESKLAALLGRG